MKSILSIFAVKAVVITTIVGAVALGVWYVHFALEELLSSPHTFGNVTITPYGHRQNNLLDHFYDSILVEQGQSTYMVRGPHLDITLFGENQGILLEVDELSANQALDSTSKPPVKDTTKAMEAIEFPDKIRVPFPVKFKLGKLNFTMGEMGWQAQNILLKNNSQKNITLSADSIKGSYIKDPVSLQLDIDFAEKNLVANGKIKTRNDNIALNASAPKQDLTQLKASTNISIKDPLGWVPMKLPKSIPAISNLNFNGNVSTSLTKNTLQYNFTLKTHIGEVWPFLPLDATIKVNGSPRQTNIESVFRNSEGGHINLDGVINDKLDFDFSGEIAYMSAMYGPQMMPMDMDIQSITKNGDVIDASIETREGSVIKAHVKTKDSLKVFFAANLSAMEPWALDWVKGNVEIGKNPKIIGSFQNNKLRAYLKADSIINAYHFKADSLRLQLLLDLDRGYIEFPKVTLYTPKEEPPDQPAVTALLYLNVTIVTPLSPSPKVPRRKDLTNLFLRR